MKLLKREKFAVVISLVILALALGFSLGRQENELSFSISDSGYKGRGELYAMEFTADTVGNNTRRELININSCTKAELESLPGIGPVLAERIIDYRISSGGFRTVEDITKVRGIGAVVYQQVYMYISVE